ncbi:MAG: transcription elongation factor GreA [Candidatus Tyloplasma litorale]|nr:MAG: transcription elongation factor GreA [Mycoplasmatales bacterium]
MAKNKFNIGVNLDDSNKIELTSEGKKDLEEKLSELINVERPKMQAELAEARAQGDLSENAEYDAAKNKQVEIEAEIAKIEDILVRAKIIKVDKNTSEVHLGSKVKYEKDGKEFEVVIVPDSEYNPFFEVPKISASSIFAKSIMGSKEGSEITINTDKKYKIKILKISVSH